MEHFLFKVLCETSKLLWSSTYLFRDGIPGIEKQQNYRTIEGILNEGILQAVRSLVPVKSILKDFVNMDSSDHTPDEDSDDDDTNHKDNTINNKDNLTKSNNETNVETVHENKLINQTNKTNVDDELNKNKNTNVSNEIIQPVVLMEKEEVKEDIPQTIIIEDKPNVRFGQFDAVFDLDHPSDSEMIYDPKESESEKSEEQVPDLQILDETGIPLSDGIDFDSLDASDETQVDDYEEL